MTSAKRDLLNAILLLAFSGLAYIGSTQIPIQGFGKTEANFFPNIIIAILVFLSVCLLAQSIYRFTKEPRAEKITIRNAIRHNKKVIITFGLFAVYVFILPWAGYFIASILFLISLYTVLTPNKNKIVFVILFMIGLVFILYVVFRQVLSVFLPPGILF
ncbi:tripartite tricarboxylate transporter TctB family protein [Oceanobacillus sp. 1P07AA]|uniref:tripartite tricarboxylate transporter TctB family protein n=1 Tax=Oceanobacillus sp. 1P07AA TaxID=3132293 RepID=UPI0039A6A2D9